MPGKLDTQAALKQVEQYGLNISEIIMQVERKHIFTHIEWDMCGIYAEVKSCGGPFNWLTKTQIMTEAALPTAFRQFLPETFCEKT